MSDFNSYAADIDFTAVYNLFQTNGGVKHYKKGDYFARQGSRLRYWGLIVSGGFKFGLADFEGERHVTGFVFENDLVGDFLATTRRKPVRADIIAVSDADVMVCSIPVIERFLAENEPFRLAIAENLFSQAYDQYLELHLKSPKDRYLDLLKRSPDIVQKISLWEIASYLRVTPTHLSRIRKELTFSH